MPAIHEIEGPALLLAGPGTGKTTRLAQRLRYLIEERDVDPESIAVITFTRVAAEEMKARIADRKRSMCFISPEKRPRKICTMHSLGMRIISDQRYRSGLPSMPGVVERQELRGLLLGDAAQRIGELRAAAEETESCRTFGKCTREDTARCQICEEYERILFSCGAVDYDDQILLACDILEQSDDVRETWQVGASHLLVDEYQDINAAQFRFVQLLSEHQRDGVFCVGDDDQSIYSWRGGSPEFIRRFAEDFGDTAKTRALLHSYRCHRQVLEGAQAVLESSDPEHTTRGTYEYEEEEGAPIVVHNVASQKQEARLVKAIVAANLSTDGALVLVPRWNYADDIVAELRTGRIRFSKPSKPPSGGFSILSDLFDWLENAEASLKLRNLMNSAILNPRYGVPSPRARRQERLEAREEALARIAALWSPVLDESASLWEALLQANSAPFLNRLATELDELRSFYNEGHISELLKKANDTLQIWKRPNDVHKELSVWIDNLRSQQDPGSAFVRVLTQHQAKGLEAGVVCITGLEEGTVPPEGCSPEQLAESARLLYVSMTRAKRELHLFHCRSRPGLTSFQNVHSREGTHMLTQSRFLDVLPESCKVERYHRPETR